MDDPSSRKPETWVTLAHLLRPQGRKGELLADLHTDFPERFAGREGISLRRANGNLEPATVESHWLPVGRNAGRIVLKLQGIDSINAAELLNGCDLVVPPEQRVPLAAEDDGEDLPQDQARYIADLLDCTVFDGEHSIGTVHDVHFPTNAVGARLPDAMPLLVVHAPSGDELLIPFANSWIEAIDIPGKRIAMHLPEGLLEING